MDGHQMLYRNNSTIILGLLIHRVDRLIVFWEMEFTYQVQIFRKMMKLVINKLVVTKKQNWKWKHGIENKSLLENCANRTNQWVFQAVHFITQFKMKTKKVILFYKEI